MSRRFSAGEDLLRAGAGAVSSTRLCLRQNAASGGIVVAAGGEQVELISSR